MTSAERTTELSGLGRQIALELRHTPATYPWVFVGPIEDTYSVYLSNPENKARIYLQFDGYEKPSRLSISGYLHIGKNGQYVEVYEKGENGTGWNRATLPNDVTTSANDCSLKLDTLSFEQAEHIIRYLKGIKKEGPWS